jgi:uncharacterized Zn finger protein
MYQNEWTKAVHTYIEQNKEKIERVIDDPEALDELMDDINRELLDKPTYYFNEESLRQSHRIIAGVRDFFLAAMGKTKLPTRDEQLEEFKRGLVSKFADIAPGASQRRTQMVKQVANNLIGDSRLLKQVTEENNLAFLARPEFSQVYQTKDWLEEFKNKDELLDLVHDIAESELLKV